ncbi:hypothetical protein JYU09_01945 [bacterium AH-315-O15]|nr:hypothetical protein [bacterium AH-315-O15]
MRDLLILLVHLITTTARLMGQAQRFLLVHGLVQNLFRVGRHLLRAAHHRVLRRRSFCVWDAATCSS